jgi:hypothetical protein
VRVVMFFWCFLRDVLLFFMAISILWLPFSMDGELGDSSSWFHLLFSVFCQSVVLQTCRIVAADESYYTHFGVWFSQDTI